MEEEQLENFSNDKGAFQQPVIGINAHTMYKIKFTAFHVL